MYYLLGFDQANKVYIIAQGGKEFIMNYKKQEKTGYGPNDWHQLKIVMDVEDE